MWTCFELVLWDLETYLGSNHKITQGSNCETIQGSFVWDGTDNFLSKNMINHTGVTLASDLILCIQNISVYSHFQIHMMGSILRKEKLAQRKMLAGHKILEKLNIQMCWCIVNADISFQKYWFCEVTHISIWQDCLSTKNICS